MANICFISNFSFPIIHTVRDAIESNGHEMTTWAQSEHFGDTYSTEEMKWSIDNTSLIIFDISKASEAISYGIGFFAAKSKPMIFIADDFSSIPLEYQKFNVLIYDINSVDEFINRLSNVIEQVLNNPNSFTYFELEKQRKELKKIFISYSHKDKEYMDRILMHLKPLETKGLIDVWVDEEIKAGDDWKNVIEKALENSNIAILLISADYLASDFIVQNELPPLLKNAADKKGTRLMSVIIKPCRFTRDTNLNVFQAINNPKKPIISLSECEQEEIYEKIAEQIEERLKSERHE
jgi:hypothetical protein